MIGKAVDIPTPDGTMDSYAAHPDGPGKFALVVLFMDIWGLREELFAITRRLAAHGYYCVVPNLYYREEKSATSGATPTARWRHTRHCPPRSARKC